MRRLRLKDLGRWYSGGTPPREVAEHWRGDVPWLSAKDIDRTALREPTAFITRAAAREHSKCVPAGTLLVIVRGMALAHGLPVVQTGREAAFNQDLRGLVCSPDVEPRFAYYALLGARRRLNRHIDRAAHGTARVTESIYSERVDVPPQFMQRRVADFLDHECERIGEIDRVRRHQFASLDALRTAAVRDAIRDLRSVRLKYAASVIDCKHRTAEYVEGGWPLVSTREVTRGALVVDESTRGVAEVDFHDLREGGRDPRRGDIIYSRNATVGVAAFVSTDVQVCMGQDVVLITRRPRDCELLSMVLNWGIQDQIDRLAIGSTFSRINVLTIRELAVPDDRADREAEALRQLRETFARLAALEAVVDSSRVCLAEYRDALIAEAVTGTLDVARLSDRQLDESAHAAMEGERPEVLTT